MNALSIIKYDDEFTAVIGDYSYFLPLVIGAVFIMGDVSDANFSMENCTLSQHYCGYNNGDVRSGNGFINSHTISQCDDPSAFKKLDRDVLYESKCECCHECFGISGT